MENQGNIIGPLALLAWFPITFFLFTRFRPTTAGSISIVAGGLFLPENVKFLVPIFPDLDKTIIPVVATFLACWWKAPQKMAEARPMSMDFCLLIMCIGRIGTWRTNTDVLFGGNAPLPRASLSAYDAITFIVFDIVLYYGLFWLGRMLVSRAQDVIAFLRVCFFLGLIYSLFCLIELRMSPQMNSWVYGFMQHDFSQTVRGGGYRPMVFMSHGLTVARFMAVAALSGVLLWRLNALSSRAAKAVLWSIIILVWCKSTGATVMFVMFAPFIAFGKSASQARFGMVLAFLVALYPLLRGLDYIPVDDILELATNVSEERAASLQTRFDNEAAILERVHERLSFGWGGNDRHQIYDPYQQGIFIIDGEWIGMFVYRGLFGFVGYYGFYVLPLLMAARTVRSMASNDYKLLLGGLMLIAGVLALDTLPNSSSSFPQFFWMGAIAGASRGLAREDAVRKAKLREQRRKPAPDADPAAA